MLESLVLRLVAMDDQMDEQMGGWTTASPYTANRLSDTGVSSKCPGVPAVGWFNAVQEMAWGFKSPWWGDARPRWVESDLLPSPGLPEVLPVRPSFLSRLA